MVLQAWKKYENEHPSTLVHYKKKLKIVDESGQCVRQKEKKRKTILPTSITTFFSRPKHYKPINLGQQQFIEDLVLFIKKHHKHVGPTNK